MLAFEQSRGRLHEISRTFHWGYFFESVDYVLKKAEKNQELTVNDKKILRNAKKFLQEVKQGQEEVKSGILGSSAIDSIGAYKQSLLAFSMIKPQKTEEFDSFISDLINLIDKIEKSESIEKPDRLLLKDFFHTLNVESLRDTGRVLEALHPRRGPAEWIAIY